LPRNLWLKKGLTYYKDVLARAVQYTEADIEEGCRLAGITSPTEKLAIKLEAEMRKMLLPRPGTQDNRRLYGKSMRASADERPSGKILTDADGQPVTLRFMP
jgi:hypothetical protein